MRTCPNCNSQSIPAWRLVFQALGIPGVVAECKECSAVVFLKGVNNPLAFFILEIAFYVLLFFLIVWSINWLGVMWPAFVIAVLLFLARLWLKSKESLDYVR